MVKRSLHSLVLSILVSVFAGMFAFAGVSLPASQSNMSPSGLSQSFEIQPRRDLTISPNITGPGRLVVAVQWSGAGGLNLLLLGPGQSAPYARRYGPAPLEMTFMVSRELAGLGTEWRIVLQNPANEGVARGEVRYAFQPQYQGVPAVEGGMKERSFVKEAPLRTPVPEQTLSSSQAGAKAAGSAKVYKFEVVDKGGLSAAELAEMQAGLDVQKRRLLKLRLEKGLDNIFSESNLAPLILPIAVAKLEEMGAAPSVYAGIDVSPHLRDLSRSIREINLEKAQRYFPQERLKWDLRNKADRIALGRAIILAVEPDFDQRIREAVAVSLGKKNPKFPWRSTAVRTQAVLRSGTGAGRAGAELSAPIGAAAADLSRSSSLLARTQALERLKGLVDATRFKSDRDISVQQRINPEDLRRYVPDLNSVHDSTNYLNYRVELDRFTCIRKNERSNDEAYFILQRMLPRFDPRSVEYAGELGSGRLYNVFSSSTRVYGGISTGETVPIVSGERLLFDQQLYGADASFVIDLFESDYSTSQVKGAYQDAAARLREFLQREIKAAVVDAIKDTILAGLREVVPAPVIALVDAIASGNFDESTIERLQDALGGLQTDIIILSMLFSGKSFTEILNFISGGCPELYLIILAIDVCGPILVDFLQGDWREAFRAILFLPATIFRSFINIFKDIESFFSNLMAALDPDDHIQTRRVSISAAPAPLGSDANWDQRNQPAGGGQMADQRPPTHLRSAARTIEPELWFFGSSAFYKLFYRVTRVVYGGKDVFGFTLDPQKGISSVQKFYTVKSPYYGDKIKVKISTLDTLDVPIVCVAGAGGSNVNISGEREFLVNVSPGGQYTVTIATFFNKPIYGFVSLEENSDPQPYTGPSGGGGSVPSGGGGGGGGDGQRHQVK